MPRDRRTLTRGEADALTEQVQRLRLTCTTPCVHLRQRSRFTEAPSAAVPDRIRHEVTHRLPAGTSGIGGKVARAGQKDR